MATIPVEEVKYYNDAELIKYPEDYHVPEAEASQYQRKRGGRGRWSQAEHRLFLEGVRKLGKGAWNSISREYVKSRTAAQVASHAQKFFMRQNLDCDKKKRSSIHDTPLLGDAHYNTTHNHATPPLGDAHYNTTHNHATPPLGDADNNAMLYLYDDKGFIWNIHEATLLGITGSNLESMEQQPDFGVQNPLQDTDDWDAIYLRYNKI